MTLLTSNRKIPGWIKKTPRWVLGVVFIWASWSKIADPVQFAEMIRGYQLLPSFLINPAALGIPWLEAVAGVCLLTGFMSRGGALIVDIMLIVFILAFIVNLYRGIDVNCGCFSLTETAKKSMLNYLFRDAVILALGIWVLFWEIKRQANA